MYIKKYNKNSISKGLSILYLVIFINGIILPSFFQIDNFNFKSYDQNNSNNLFSSYYDNNNALNILSWLNISSEVADYLIYSADKLNGYSWNSSGLYYMNKRQGAAGIGLYLLELYELTKNSSYLEAAKKIGDWFNYKKAVLSKPGKWPQSDSQYSENYTGLEDGAAGVGLFLYNLYKYTGNSTILGLANDVTNYLESLKVDEGAKIKYPKKESLKIENVPATFYRDEAVIGGASGNIANLAYDDDIYYSMTYVYTSLSVSNFYNPNNTAIYSISSQNSYPYDGIRISQQFSLNSYPLNLTNGVTIMLYRNPTGIWNSTYKRIRVGIFEAQSTGLPNMTTQIGGWSEKLWNDPEIYTQIGHNVTFTWSSNTPLLNGSSVYGYCLVIETTADLDSADCFYIVVTNNYAFGTNKLSYEKYGWKTGTTKDTLVFNFADNSKYYSVRNFKFNLTDFGLNQGFDTRYIKNITLKCRAKSSVSINYDKVFVYDRLNNLYIPFGNITTTEQEFTLTINKEFTNYLYPIVGTIVVRIASGSMSSSFNINIDVLNITLNYNDEYYGYDLEYGITGIGYYFLKIYEITKNNTYLDNAFKIGNMLIDNANLTEVDGKNLAAWISEDGKYRTSLISGMAGIGKFLLELSKLNNLNSNYREYAKYAANWLINNTKRIAVYDYLYQSIGAGVYWWECNITSSIYTGYYYGIAGIIDFLIDLGLACSRENEENIYLRTALESTNFLISSYDINMISTSAKQEIYTYTWATTSYPRGMIDLTYYKGTAGIMKILNKVYMVSHNINYSKCVSGAYEFFRANFKKNPYGAGGFWNTSGITNQTYGLESGIAGIGMALMDISFNSYYSYQAAQSAINWLYSKRYELSSNKIIFYHEVGSNISYNGLAYGTAGIGLTFLNMYRKTANETYFDWASYCARGIQNPNDWTISRTNNTLYFGIDYGLAGIGLFFLEMVKASDDSWYQDTLKLIANTLINSATSDGDKIYWPISNSSSVNYFGWDKGVAGIMYFLTEMYKFYKNQTYLNYAEAAARWLDNYDANGVWDLYLGSGGNKPYGFSVGAAGIGFSLLNLYEITNNNTYLSLVNQVYQSLTSAIGEGIPEHNGMGAEFYNGWEKGQAGFIKFYSRYYQFNKSTQVKSALNTLENWFYNKQEYNGAYNISISNNSQYCSFKEGASGIMKGLIDSYAINIDSKYLNIIENLNNFIVNSQISNQYWDDIYGGNIPLNYYEGVAGIIDQSIKVPDLEGPTLDLVTNISLNEQRIQYYDYLEVNISSNDISSGISKVVLAYKYNNAPQFIETEFVKVTTGLYRLVFPNNNYLTNVTFYVVAIDGSGIINIDDNNTYLYKFTYFDDIAPVIGYPITFDPDGVPADLQYEIGGRIVVFIDEPPGSSGISQVLITYDNLNDIIHPPVTTNMTKLIGLENFYYIDIPGSGYKYGDDFIFNITAVDNAKNSNSTQIFNIKIGDNKLPKLISKVVQTQTKIPAFQKVHFAIGAIDSEDIGRTEGSGVEFVYLNYTLDRGNTWQQLYLEYDTASNLYIGDFPGQMMGKSVVYMICIKDRAGNIAYYDSQDTRYNTPDIPWVYLYKFDIVINWTITIIITALIAGILIFSYLIYTKKTDYWERMRAKATTTARFITIQDKLSNFAYSILEKLIKIGNWFLDKFQRPPGTPNPIKEWFEKILGEKGLKLVRGIGRGFKSLGKFLGLCLLSPLYLIAALVKHTGIKRALFGVLISLLLIIFSVVKYISEPPYPMRAIFFINFGFILFIGSFIIFIFHLIYRIAYK